VTGAEKFGPPVEGASRPSDPTLRARDGGWLPIIGCGMLAFAAAALVMYPRLAASHFDPQVYVRYDGWFALFLAHTLPQLDPAAADIPAYRAQRVLLSALVAVVLRLSGQQPGLQLDAALPDTGPWAMLAVNSLAQVMGTVALAALARRHSLSPFLGLLFGVWIGSLYVLQMGMTELLAYALVLWSLLFWEREKLWISAVLMAFAILTKETAALFGAALVISLLIQRRRATVSFVAVAFGPAVAWQLRVTSAFGITGVQAAFMAGNPGDQMTPIGAFFLPSDDPFWLVQLGWILIPSIVAVIWGAFGLRRKFDDPAAWALLLNGGFVASLPPASVECLCWSSRIGLAIITVLGWAMIRSGRGRTALAVLTVLLLPSLLFVLTGGDFGPLSAGGIESR